MKHELKIVMEFEEKKPISITNVKVSIDDKQVGAIQKLILNADMDRLFVDLDIENIELTPHTIILNPQLAHLGKDLEPLKSVPMVNIITNKI